MNWSPSSEVERREVVKPAVRIPGPTSDRTVDNSRPKESKDEGRYDTTPLERATDHDLYCTGTIFLSETHRLLAREEYLPEQKLIETEDDFRNDSRAGRRGCHDIFHSISRISTVLPSISEVK
jgi:hypothetical protein